MVDHLRLPERERHSSEHSPADAPAFDPGRMCSHYILVAWQDGVIGYRDAIRLTASDTLFELYEACMSSGVPLRKTLTPREEAVVDGVVRDILGP